MVDLVNYQLVYEFGVDPALAPILTPPVAAGFVAHYAGDEEPTQDILNLIYGLKLDPASAQLGYYLEWIWTDLAPADNTVILGE